MKNIDLNDPTTINLISALFRAYKPLPSKIQKITGLSKSLISDRLDYLYSSGACNGVFPRLHLGKCGMGIVVFGFYNLSKNMKSTYDKVKEVLKNDPHVILAGDTFGPDNTNAHVSYVFEDVNAWQANQSQNYWGKIPELNDFVRNRYSILASLSHIKKLITFSNVLVDYLSRHGSEGLEGVDPKLVDPDTISIMRAMEKDVYELQYNVVEEKTAMSRASIHKKTKELYDSGVILSIDPHFDFPLFGFNTFLYGFYNFNEKTPESAQILKKFYAEPRIAYWGVLMGDRGINNFVVGLFKDALEYTNPNNPEYWESTPELSKIVRKRSLHFVPMDTMYKRTDPSVAAMRVLSSKIKEGKKPNK